jgi:hypothetical protein
LENSVSSDRSYQPDQLFTEVENHAATLRNQGLWKLSDRSLEEQALAMLSQKKQNGKQQHSSTKSNSTNKKDSNSSSDSDKQHKKRLPPFHKQKGKIGDSKEWKGEKYYFCPAKHRNSQWHKFPVLECNTYKKQSQSGNVNSNGNNDKQQSSDSKVVVDRSKLKKGMAALLPAGDYDPDDLAEALMAALN